MLEGRGRGSQVRMAWQVEAEIPQQRSFVTSASPVAERLQTAKSMSATFLQNRRKSTENIRESPASEDL